MDQNKKEKKKKEKKNHDVILMFKSYWNLHTFLLTQIIVSLSLYTSIILVQNMECDIYLDRISFD